MQSDGEDARTLRRFAYEQGEGILQAAQHLVGGVALDGVDDGVVDLEVVGQGDQFPGLGAHPVGHVVYAPVADVIDACRGQQVRRVVALAQARSEPAARARAGEFLDHVEGGGDDFGLGAGVVERLLVHTVADEFPVRLEHGLGGARVGVDHAGVKAGGGGQAAFGDGAQDTRQPGAHAVVGPAEIGHVGHGFLAVRRGDDGARHGGVKLPVLHVDHQVNHDALVRGRGQRRAFIGKAIGNARVGHDGCPVKKTATSGG